MTTTIRGADLRFEAASHTYWLPDGTRVPSVTQILRAVGISTDFEAIVAQGGARADAIEYKRALGTALHQDAHALDDHDLDWSTVHPDVLPYLEAWQAFRDEKRLIPLTRERRLYSPTLGVCGTLDGVFYRPGEVDRRILIDIKTGDPESAGARYQTALYQLLWQEEHPEQPIAERWSVELTPEREIPYRIHPYGTWTDLMTARALVTTFYAQPARRRTA